MQVRAQQNDAEHMWKHVKRQSRLGSGSKRKVLTFSVFFNEGADCIVICNELCMPQYDVFDHFL